MAGLNWAALVLLVFLSAGASSAPVDNNWLTSVIEGIKNQYALGDAFSVAVNVPQNQDVNNLQQVFQDDPADQVKQVVSQGQVYQGTRVVAATQPEALSRVLENINSLTASSQGNFLVIYSAESPCGPTCTTNVNQDSKINNVIQNWSGYVFAFSKVYNVPAESFKQLEISKLGLDNIFHCYKPDYDPFQCVSCSSGGDVTPSCVANQVPSYQDTGSEIAPGEETGGGGGMVTGGQESKCKGRGRACKGRGGRKPKKTKKQCKRKGGCEGKEGGKPKKVKKQCKRKGGCEGKGGGKPKKGGKVGKERKQKKGKKAKNKKERKGKGRYKRRAGRGGGSKSKGRSYGLQ